MNYVYRLSRLYDRLSERSALIMLAAWRGSTMAVTRAKYRPALYDDERSARARPRPDPSRPYNPAQRRRCGPDRRSKRVTAAIATFRRRERRLEKKPAEE